MPEITDKEFLGAAFAEHVSELPANLYYASGTAYDIRIALGTSKLTPEQDVVIGKFHTAVLLDYKLAKQLVSTLQNLIDGYERTYGPADVLEWKE